jgi:hypothetical protein
LIAVSVRVGLPEAANSTDTFPAALVAALAMLSLTSCGESKQAVSSSSPSPSQSTVPISVSPPGVPPPNDQPSDLVSDRDLIEWRSFRHRPDPDGSTGLPPSAIEVGDIDLARCRNVLDVWSDLHHDLADTEMGYRDRWEIAWADDNPGYDVNARPAPRLKHVLQQAGNDC